MIFDRISLVKAYTSLKIVELNDGGVKDILFNKTAYYGTKTIERFKTLADLRAFINENYPFQYFDPNCQCAVTSKDAIWTPLSFNLTLPKDRFATFVNNMRQEFESAQEVRLNKTSVDACKAIFTSNARLATLKKNYSCFEYVVNQNQYVAPCEYIDLIVNDAYTELVTKLYPLSKNKDLKSSQIFRAEQPADILPDASIPELIITTTTTQAPCLAIAVDGYYPLYATQACAEQHIGGNGNYHTHDLGSPVTTYYMPGGLNQDPNNGTITQWHGNYVQITTTTTQAPTTTTTTQGPQAPIGFTPSPGPVSYY